MVIKALKALARILFFTLFLMPCVSVKAQNEGIILPPVMPEFRDDKAGLYGESGLIQFVVKNMKYPYEARKHEIQGTVFVTFIINKKGEVDSAKILRSPHELLSQEALRVINLTSGKWVPGRDSTGKEVRVKYQMPLKFSLRGDATPKINPADRYYNKGVEAMDQDRNKAAIQYFKEALLLNDMDSMARYNLGVSYFRLNQADKACREWQKLQKAGIGLADDLIDKYCRKPD